MPSCTALWTHEGGQPALCEPERGVMNFVKKNNCFDPENSRGQFLSYSISNYWSYYPFLEMNVKIDF